MASPAVQNGNQSAGLTPQMSIVNPDLTPTVFFFRWLLNTRSGNQTPWKSDIDAAGYALDNLGGLTLTGPITFPDGTTQDSASGSGGGGAGGAVSSVFGRTGAVKALAGDYTAALVTNAVDQQQRYANPAWITSLDWSKITNAPALGGDFGDTIKVNSVGISDDPTITVNAPPFFAVNGAAWPQGTR